MTADQDTAVAETSSRAASFTPAELAAVLAHRRWARRLDPFPHVVARNVFVPDFYDAMAAQFREIEARPDAPFRRNIRGYDAASADVSRYADGPLGVFVSRSWNDLIADVAGVASTGDVLASLHHHDPGSQRGWPHQDLNPGWFADPMPGPGDVRTAYTDGVDYHNGARPDGINAHESMRAVSILFYLGNPPWQPGDGGESGLFASSEAGFRADGVTVPPVNNSLVLFECTPFSWHTFLSNRLARNSVVMWLHRTKSDAVRRWGESSVVYW